jgi:hypothetical protein
VSRQVAQLFNLARQENIMKVRFLPFSPKAGIETHIDNATGRILVAGGFAEQIPYKNAAERLAAEAPAQTVGVYHNVSVVGVEWGFDTKQFASPVIIKRQGSETTYYDAPVAGCPAAIIKQWEEATNQVYVSQNAGLEAAQNAQILADTEANNGKWKYLARK